MIAERPDLPGLARRLLFVDLGDRVLEYVLGPLRDPYVEPEETHVDLPDAAQNFAEFFRVEVAVHGEFVVSQGVCLALVFREPVQADALRLVVTEFLERHVSPMSFDDEVIVSPDADRIEVAELLD